MTDLIASPSSGYLFGQPPIPSAGLAPHGGRDLGIERRINDESPAGKHLQFVGLALWNDLWPVAHRRFPNIEGSGNLNLTAKVSDNEGFEHV